MLCIRECLQYVYTVGMKSESVVVEICAWFAHLLHGQTMSLCAMWNVTKRNYVRKNGASGKAMGLNLFDVIESHTHAKCTPIHSHTPPLQNSQSEFNYFYQDKTNREKGWWTIWSTIESISFSFYIENAHLHRRHHRRWAMFSATTISWIFRSSALIHKM